MHIRRLEICDHTRLPHPFPGGLNVASGGQIFLKWEQLALLGMRGRNRAALFSPPPIWLDIDNAGGAAFCARITREHRYTAADYNTGR